MTSRQKRISWIVAGIMVQGLVIFGTIYFMEYQYARVLTQRAIPVVSDDGRESLDLSRNPFVGESAAPAPATEFLAPQSSPQVRELIKIERGSATEIAKTIRELFGERAKVSAVESSSSVVVMADQATLTEIVEFIHQLSGRSRELEEAQSNLTEKAEELIVESLPEPRSTIPDSRPPAFPNRDESDPFASQPEAISHRNELKYISIRSGSPESIATAVKDVFGASVRVTPENGSQSVIVVADPETQERVSDFIAKIEERTEERNSERRKVVERRKEQQAEEVKRSTAESLKQFPRSQPEVTRTQPPPVTHRMAEELPHDPFGPSIPQEENISSKAKFPADVQDAELDRLAKRLALRIREAKPGDQANLRKELETITSRQFQHRQQRRQQEFESLSQRLEQLKANHQRRQKHQAEVVERRIKDLLDPNADLRWEERELSDERPADVATLRSLGESEEAFKRVFGINSPTPKEEAKKSESKQPEPTYNGVTLSEWTQLLLSERNEEKFAEAVAAMNYLADQADPHELATTIFRMIRNLNPDMILQVAGGMAGMGRVPLPPIILRGLIRLLTQLPAEVVVQEFLSELGKPVEKKSTQELLGWFLYSFEANMISHDFHWNGQSIHADLVSFQESRRRLKAEIRRRSRELITRLVAIASKDESLTNWSVRCAEKIIRISEQTLTTYPDLVPLVNRLFDKPVTGLTERQQFSPFYQGPVAAVLLGESGLRIPEILAFANKLTEKRIPLQQPATVNRSTDFADGLRCIVAIGTYSPEGVRLLDEILDRNLKEMNAYSTRLEGSPLEKEFDIATLRRLTDETALVIDSLAEIGVPASDSITRLNAIAESPNAQTMVLPLRPQVSESGPNGITSTRFRNLVDLAKSAVKKISDAKPKPKPEPLPEDDYAEPENASASGITTPNGKPQITEPTPPSRPIDETTYDGITYTQWLKLLETERKLDKVIAAIDTCTRLAVKGDERRIAKGVFVAEALFESEDGLKTEAWNVGQTGLARLPTEIVIDELLLALRNSESFKTGRQFQYQFLIEFEHFRDRDREAQLEILRSRSTEIVQEVVKLIPAETDANSLPAIAAASQVCNLANGSISDFDGLTDRMIKVVTAVPADEKKVRVELWFIVAGTLTQQAPDTPDLATVLVKQTEKHVPASYPIVELIGRLGARAEPAVPTIVQLFIVEFNKIVTTSNSRLMPRSIPQSALEVEESRRNSENAPRFCFQVIRTIGEIGQGQMGYDLVSELKQFDFPIDTGLPFHMRAKVQEPMKALIAEAETAYSKFQGFKHSGNQLLSDLWVMNGRWAEKFPLKATSDSKLSDVKFTIRGTVLSPEGSWMRGSTLSPLLVKLDPNASVQISIVEDTSSRKKLRFTALNTSLGGRRTPKSVEGLYQLSDSILKLQLAPPDQPAPEEFCTDPNSLPEGHILIELQRIAPVPANADENDKH